MTSAEQQRLNEDALRTQNWKRWGPYLSERQWGTVREDYSSDGNSWAYFPHDHARSRAYRWGEDGLLGFSDRQCRICFAVALWNGKDPILKERLYGLTGPEGNHGEDVKECYYYLDSTPTHSYVRGLYKYPQNEFPYKELLEVNQQRDRVQDEYELEDTGIFDKHEYFDVTAEFAKDSCDDILIRLTIANRSDKPAKINAVPTVWFRNTWSWGCEHEGCWPRPGLRKTKIQSGAGESEPKFSENEIELFHVTLERYKFAGNVASDGTAPELIFTENETNLERVPIAVGKEAEPMSSSAFTKDAFHRYIVDGEKEAINPKGFGTKCGFNYDLTVPAQGQIEIQLRLFEDPIPKSEKTEDTTERLDTKHEKIAATKTTATPADSIADPVSNPFGDHFEKSLQKRIDEANEFYEVPQLEELSVDERRLKRQADAGLLWTKQFYHYVVEDWLNGDPNGPVFEDNRKWYRNRDWKHLFNRDVLSMPDKWEYPWFAAWDTAFHMIPMANLDSEFAKDQLILFLREWYMHPNGQIPAYEWALDDVNPPVHAWACWRTYQIDAEKNHGSDRVFLSRTFQKLCLNFTWWINQKDPDGNNVFSGGFLGLDNIGVFDRSKPLPTGGSLEQADGTGWMAFYCANMLSIALELAAENPAYGDMASKFFEHYIAIAEAMNREGKWGLWDDHDGFYYDNLICDNDSIPLKIRSLVGLIPLLTGVVLHDDQIDKLPGFSKRMQWFLEHNRNISDRMTYLEFDCPEGNSGRRRLLAVPSQDRLRHMLHYMLDENEFLSPFGIRSLSKVHEENPYQFNANGETYSVGYIPGESDTWMFGGNSNWRGPVWFPLNFLIVEALRNYHAFYGDQFQIECPTGSGNLMNLSDVADEIQQRLISIFISDQNNASPWQGASGQRYTNDPNWKELFLFHEYFHGDNGTGLGASHQTGWTALIATLLDQKAKMLSEKR